MKRKWCSLALLLIVSGLILSGCGPAVARPAGSPTAAPAPTEALATPMSSTLTEAAEYELTVAAASPTPSTGEEYCTDWKSGTRMSYQEAVEIVRSSECLERGQLKGTHFCNEFTGTWWIDLDIEKPGCMPACVIRVVERTAEINWRCTGVIPKEATARTAQPTGVPTAVPPTATLVAAPTATVPVPAVTQMGCLGKIPAERPPTQSWGEIITGYQLLGQLPQNLPRSAPVFRLQAPDGSAEWAESMSRQFGFSSQLTAMQGGDPAYPEYYVSEGTRSLNLWSISGAFNYQNGQLLSPPQPPERLPKDETEAISIARAFLEQRVLLPNDCTSHPEAELQQGSWPDPKDRGQMTQAPSAWEVRFPRYLEGEAVRGFWMSGVRVTLGEGGEVAALTHLHREAEEQGIYPLKTVEEAWQEVLAGRATHVDSIALGTGGGKPQPFSVLVQEVGLGYREAEVMRLQAYLQPYYLFQGQAQSQGGEAPITLYVPALAQEWLEEAS